MVTPEEVFVGSSEMAALLRSLDWSQTPLGAVETWPQSLRSTLSICLNSRFPIAIYWGAEFLLLYNDAWRPIVGDKHPWAIGRPAREVWSEIWEDIGPELAGVLATGEGTFHNDELLSMHRFGYTEECFFEYTFNPIQGQGGMIDGVFNVVSETTYRVLNERRARLLRETAAKTGIAKTVEEACALMVEGLKSDPFDLPFALLYLVSSDGKQARLWGSTEAIQDDGICPEIVDLTARNNDLWAIEQVVRRAEPQVIDNLESRFGKIPGSPWAEPPREAMVLPIVAAAQDKVTGVLVAVASPRRKLDDNYCDFFNQIATQIATTITNAQAYEAERQRAEALAELDRAKTTFFSNVSHEFRTPLTLMLSPLEELSTMLAGQLQPEQQEQLQLIQRNGLRLQKLVNTLLDFSRIEAGRIQVSYEPIDLAAYTAELASVFRSLIEQAGIQLVIDCPPLPEPVYVDCDMWEKIVLNLLSNAFKFTFAGSITVRLQYLGSSVELSVTDTGVGIPETEVPRLFERFHQVSGTRSRTYEGSGIGLALVQELVKLHGGTIHVTSQVDHGTTFTIVVPCGTAHLPQDRIGATRTLASSALGTSPYLAEASRWTSNAAIGGSEFLESNRSIAVPTQSQQSTAPTARVLLVDDNADMRAYVQRLLSHYWEVEAVSDGSAALKAITQRPPNLVLSDVMMPGLDGFGLLRELRSAPTTQNIPVILLSARAGEEARIEGLAAGADDYLTKPFSAGELLARVEVNLKLAQLRQAAAQQEQALRVEVQAARDRLESVLTRIADQFLALDRDWRYIYVNDRVTEVTGLERENLLGRNIWELFPDIAGSQFEVEVRRAVAEQTPIQFEYFYANWHRWFENHVYPSVDGVSIIVTEITERKRAEAQLRESEKFLQAINETAPNLLYIFDLTERRNVYVSPQIFSMLGILPAEVQAFDSQVLVELFHPDDLERIEQHHNRMRAAREDDIFTIEYRMKHTSGRWLWLSSRDKVFVRDEQGNPIQILGSAIDITDRKQAELVLQQSEERARLAIQVVQLGTWRYAPSTNLVELDERMREIWGEPQGTVTISLARVIERIHPSDRERVTQAVGTALDPTSSGTYEIDYRILWDDGSERWVAANGQAQFEGEGESRRVIEFIGTALDITERKQTEAALQESETRYRLLAEAIPQLVWMTDAKGHNEYVNQRFCDYTGLTAEQMHGLNWLSILHPDDLAMTHDRWLAAVSSSQFYEIEYRFRGADGNYRWFLGQGIPLKDEQGRIYKWFGTCTDIEPQKQIEQTRLQLLAQEQTAREQAETANRIKDEFLAVLSHELRSPLNPILGWSKLLQTGKLDESKTKQALATIERNAKLQSELIEDLLDVSRILRGKLSLTVSSINLASTIQAALETVRLAAEARSIAIETRLDPEVGRVSGDSIRLQQIVWNLLSNAVKFTPTGGQVTVQLEQVNDQAQITVRDTGKGIAPDFLPYVFDYFRQADSATTRKFGGLGLGLAIVRHLVELHGGTVQVESPGERQGATFTVRLPLLATPATLNQKEPLPRHPLDLSGRRILVVEDEIDARELLVFLLEEQGAQVVAATSAREALLLLARSRPDVLISDIGMPEMDGYMLIQQVRQLTPEQGGQIPAIALTAYAGEMNQQQALAAGFQKHISKPIEPEKLFHLISSLIKT